MRLSRRTLLAAAGASIAAAGCIGNDEDPEDDEGINPDGDDEDADDARDDEDDDGNGDDEPAGETVVVAPDGDHRFDPETLEIDPETTVEFVWEAGGHNLVVEAQPDESEWEGVSDLADEGETHEHAFEVEGRYEYVCEPHAGDGMEGEIVVGDADGANDADDAEDDTGDDTGGY